ncbi:MAG: hypothetical protein LBV52_02410 [Spirochaetaceae bacterium]|jgi:hypothetical protein|nr:hypothetical protein [Spirochaetaceae bacterium]
MIIQKCYEISPDDLLNFQEYWIEKTKPKKNIFAVIIYAIICFLPIFFLSFMGFSKYIINNVSIRYACICMAMFLFVLLSIYSTIMKKQTKTEKIKKNLSSIYYGKYKTENIDFEINTEKDKFEFISNLSQTKFSQNWICDCTKYKDYIFLLGAKSDAIIIPKKYLSAEEEKAIIEYAKNSINYTG